MDLENQGSTPCEFCQQFCLQACYEDVFIVRAIDRLVHIGRLYQMGFCSKETYFEELDKYQEFIWKKIYELSELDDAENN